MRKYLAPALAGVVLLPGAAAAKRQVSPGCKTKACAKRVCKTTACRGRVTAKALARGPHRPALASWYGPSLYGNPLGCAGKSLPASATLQPGTLGVAHKTLGCGTRVHVCVRRCATVAVVDRGPYVGDREFDLTAATAQAVGFSGVGTIRVRVGG